MPLSGDQKALLQLLCERGQSYEDISGLLGITADEVRLRARSALTDLGGSDPDAGEVPLTDYLLGQADPIGRADAVRHLQADPEALERAERIQDGLRELAPDAKQPKLPEARGKRRRAALPTESGVSAEPAGTGPAADAGGGSAKQSRLIAAIVAAGIVLIVVILAVAGVFSGGDDSSATTATTATGETINGSEGGEGENITTVDLSPVGSSGVAGQAIFGLISNEQLYVDLDVQGLDPEQKQGGSYLVWLMVGDDAGYPIDRLEPDPNGSFSGRLAVPTAIAVAVGNQARSVVVSSTSVSKLQSEIEKAAQQQVPILPFTGSELASGDIPLVEGQGGGAAPGGGDTGGGNQGG